MRSLAPPGKAGKFDALAKIGRWGWVRTSTMLVGPAIWWLALFLMVPLVLVVLFGFASLSYAGYTFNPPTLQWYSSALNPRGKLLQLTLRTIAVSALATGVALPLGYAVAYFIARVAPERWRGVLLALIVVPAWTSLVVRVYGILAFIGDNGILEGSARWLSLGAIMDGMGPLPGLGPALRIGSPQLLILTLVYVWLPLMVLPLLTSLRKLDPLLLEAAQGLGAGQLRTFYHVTLPLTWSGIISGSILVFITSMGSFVEPDLVAGARLQLVGNYIEDSYHTPYGLPRMAAASMFIIILTFILVAIYARYGDIGAHEEAQDALFSRILKRLRPSTFPPQAPNPTQLKGQAALISVFTPPRPPRPAFARRLDHLVEKGGKYALGAITVGVILCFLVPLIYIVVYSFNSGDGSGWEGLSLDWYTGAPAGTIADREGLFSDPELLAALGTSVLVALASSTIALILGTMTAFALERYRIRSRRLLGHLLSLGLVVPSIVLGLGILVLIAAVDGILAPTGLEWQTGLGAIIIGHATFNIPVATVVILLSLASLDRSLGEAAMDLGADEVATFFRVTLPNILPGLISAGLLCFTFSFDDLPTSLLLQGQNIRTLPVVIWGLLARRSLTPKIYAASCLVLAISVIFVLAASKAQKGRTIFRI